MPSSYSSNLRLELIADGEQTGAWGQTTNRNLGTLIEEAIAGISQIPLSGGSAFTLSALNGASDQARKAVLRFTGGTGTTRDIMCPTVNKVYVIDNQSSDTLKIRSTADATGVTFAPSSGGIVYSEGGVIRSVFRGTYVDTSGGTMTGKLVLPAGTSSSASLQAPHGLTPSSPQNGDIWTTTQGIFLRLDGSTYRLYASTGLSGTKLTLSASSSSSASLQLPHGAAPSSPQDGDVWTTSSGAFARINGATLQLATIGGSAPMLVDKGSAAAPGLAFTGDTDTGLHSSAANVLDLVTAGTVRWRIDSSGRLVNASRNQPCFRAVSSAIRSSTGIFGTYASEVDDGGNFNSSTGVFTVPVDGWYEFSAQFYITFTVSADHGSLSCYIFVNSPSMNLAIHQHLHNPQITTTSSSISSGPVYLASGTTLQAMCTNEVFVSGSKNYQCTMFSGRLIG